MDVKMPVLPHNLADELKSQQGRLISEITAVKTENQEAAKSLPPLPSLMASLDAVQGAKELESLGRASHSQPAFAVDINSEHRELQKYAQGAFSIELNHA